jgi:hypothetical protein
VFQELAELTLIDALLPTRKRHDDSQALHQRPTEHQAILLQGLGLELPNSLAMPRV